MTEYDYKSPATIYQEHCAKGELAYQVRTDTGEAVFYPRLMSPGTAEPTLEWRVSKGLGTVYTTTTVYPRKGDPYDVSMIDLDEGYRMMSRVEGIDPMEVTIGMRVKVRMHQPEGDEPAYPVFDRAEG